MGVSMGDRGFSRDLEKEIDEDPRKSGRLCPNCYSDTWMVNGPYRECSTCGYIKFK